MPHTIYISGLARKGKGQALLEVEHVGLYIVAGIQNWLEEWIDQPVKVIGDLKKDLETGQPVIENPVIQLLKNNDKYMHP